MRRAVKLCIPMVLFGIFVLAGLIGLLCEQFHNDLFISASAFVTSFATLSSIVIRIYNFFAT